MRKAAEKSEGEGDRIESTASPPPTRAAAPESFPANEPPPPPGFLRKNSDDDPVTGICKHAYKKQRADQDTNVDERRAATPSLDSLPLEGPPSPPGLDDQCSLAQSATLSLDPAVSEEQMKEDEEESKDEEEVGQVTDFYGQEESPRQQQDAGLDVEEGNNIGTSHVVSSPPVHRNSDNDGSETDRNNPSAAIQIPAALESLFPIRAEAVLVESEPSDDVESATAARSDAESSEPIEGIIATTRCCGIKCYRRRIWSILLFYATVVIIAICVALGLTLSDNESKEEDGTTAVPTLPSSDWLQVGQSIDGESPSTTFGSYVSISDDGSRLAIGASQEYGTVGYVQVYELQENWWIPLGSPTDSNMVGKEEDNFGETVSLSGDGRRVAIGARLSQNSTGVVKVFEWQSDSWEQLGNTIVGREPLVQCGSAVALSRDGSIVAVGAWESKHDDERGHVQLFRLNGSAWSQLGNDIDGDSDGDQIGSSVSLSSDGRIVAIGSRRSDHNGKRTSGHVRVLSYHNRSWERMGQDLDGEADRDKSGSSVSLSANGTTVAIGAHQNDGKNGEDSGHVRVFRYDTDKTVWVQLGDDIDGESAGDGSGRSVSLSADGVTVAIGATSNPGKGGKKRGHLRIYSYENLSWRPVGTDIDGVANFEKSGGSVALAMDGRRVAVGADGTKNDMEGRFVRVFDLEKL